MVNYQNGKVYKIINENNEIVYIGSTTEEKLCRRYNGHKHKAPNHKIILIENYPCNSKEELCMREQEIIEEHSDLLNKKRAYSSEEQKKITKKQTGKEYYQNNKEYLNKNRKQYRKEYYEKNKEILSEKKKIYNEKNKEKQLEKYKKNKNEISEKRKVKVICTFCNSEIRLDSLKRHQKTMKCMKFQECMILD
jgi:hypothetical protein